MTKQENNFIGIAIFLFIISAKIGIMGGIDDKTPQIINNFNKWCNSKYITKKHSVMCEDLANAINSVGSKKVEFKITETESMYDYFEAIEELRDQALQQGY